MNTDNEKLRELKEIEEPLELFKILKNDLDKLKSQINNLDKNKISSKVLSGLRANKGVIADGKEFDYTGSRLSRTLKNARAKVIPALLYKNPNDSKLRLELVGIFIKEEKNCNLLIARDAFLLVMYEIETPLISTEKINIAILIQKIFLEKFQNFLLEDFKETEIKIKGDGNVDYILEKQHKKLQGELNFIKKCLSLLQVAPIEVDYQLNLNKSKSESHIPYGDLKNGFDPMLRSLVYLPLAEKNLQWMFDILQRLEKKNPMVGFHKSKMHENFSQIQLAIGSVGKKSEYKKKGFENLNKALQAVVGALKLIGDIPEKPIEKAVVHRFSYLCYSIYGIFNSFGVAIPDSHYMRIKKALSLIEPIAKDPKFQKIQSKLIYIISEK